MNKKHFAMLMSSKEDMKKIQDILETVVNGNVTGAYAACKEAHAIAVKFNQDFGGVDPRWTPQKAAAQEAEQKAQEQARAAMPERQLSEEQFLAEMFGDY